MTDKHILDVIRAIADEHSTPTPVVEALISCLRPSIRLIPQFPQAETDSPLGRCRIGGRPDLLENVPWPRLSTAWKIDPEEAAPDDPLQFLMQINLAEVAPFDIENTLPKAGLLSFFFYWEEEYTGEAEVAYVLFSQDHSTSLRRTPPDDLPANQQYRPLSLAPCLEWTVPSIYDIHLEEAVLVQHFAFWHDVFERLAEVQGVESSNGAGVAHRLLGHPQLIQSPGMADGTRLLLQVDSDPRAGEKRYPRTGMMWGDSGRIYYRLSEEELRLHDFGAADAVVEMC